MGPDNHNPPELPEGSGRDPDKPRPTGRGDLLALLAILGAGLTAVLVGHIPVTGAVTLLTALVGLYGAYRRA